ncbi:MAG: glutaminyl-peptide cyclotransferase [Gemmatimonadaceae bacterium]|nr:glutaminyl-peptide cyclotransferase [Gemmatimonadaceae bacterium]
MTRAALLLPLLALIGCPAGEAGTPQDFVVTRQYPHDVEAYTQGLLWQDGVLYESTGRYAHSELRRVDLATGRVLQRQALPNDRFGEGLALLDGVLYQLTWESGVAYSWDARTFAPRDSFTYVGEGWGLATDGRKLWMSDGSDSLRVLDPRTFRAERIVHVRLDGQPVVRINELEWVDGVLLANVYETDRIVRIDPATGAVTRVYDFSALYPDRPPEVDVLNGISRAPVPGELLVTGKYWPTVYQVKLR